MVAKGGKNGDRGSEGGKKGLKRGRGGGAVQTAPYTAAPLRVVLLLR